VVWCGVVWCGVVWCGVVWGGVACAVDWSNLFLAGIDDFGCIVIDGVTCNMDMTNVEISYSGHAAAASGGAVTILSTQGLSFTAIDCVFAYNTALIGSAIYLECTVDALLATTHSPVPPTYSVQSAGFWGI